MLTNEEKRTISKYAKKYGIKSVLLFGSAAEGKRYNDIDLAVGGLKPKYFFKFYADLFKTLKKRVDLVDLSDDTAFTNLIKKTGTRIYG